MLLSITAAHAHAIDNVSLFCFVAKPPSLVRARRPRSPVDDIQLAVLPTTVPQPWSGIRQTTDRTATHRTRSRKRRTSDCFFLYNSPMYLYAPILYCESVLAQCHPLLLRSIHPLPSKISPPKHHHNGKNSSKPAERHLKQKFELTCCQF